MKTRLSDELLKQIATTSGRVYAYEGKAMAEELIERRANEAEDAKKAQQSSSIGQASSIPWPYGPGPLGGGHP
jgi:hypothetical protein